MPENKLLDLSFKFAVTIVNLVDSVTTPKSSYMTDQLARAGTSVGANIHEAQYAQSKKDFVAKLEIALKESNETREPLNKSAAALSGPFAPTYWFENLEIHKVFLRFPNLNLE